MKTRALGRQGLQLPELCLGTMTFGLQCDREESFRILDAAFEQGLRFLDTADVYPLGGDFDSVGRTEEIIGEWMRERGTRDQLILATKCAGAMRRGPNGGGLSRAHVTEAIEASLRRLGTDRVELYQSHAFDPRTPIDETLRAFDDLVRAGKVHYVGCSNYPAWRLGEALACADQLGLSGYVSVQPRYNLLYREIETELLPLCRERGLGVLVYNPLAGGFLSGKYRPEQEPEEGRFTLGRAGRMYQYRYWQQAQFEAVERYGKIVETRGLDPVSVGVSWVLEQEGVTSAIIGASRPEQLDASLRAPEVEWDDELREAVGALWFDLPRRPVVEGYR